jgi:hypothetical protein
VKISNIEKFFEKEAWNNFKVIREEKVAKSTCDFCDEFCLANTDKASIEFETCNRWYHLECVRLDPNDVRCDEFRWLCKNAN